MSDRKLFANAVRHARIAACLSQAQVSRATGMTRPYLSRLERGTANLPNSAEMEALADCLETPVTSLLAAAGFDLDRIYEELDDELDDEGFEGSFIILTLPPDPEAAVPLLRAVLSHEALAPSCLGLDDIPRSQAARVLKLVQLAVHAGASGQSLRTLVEGAPPEWAPAPREALKRDADWLDPQLRPWEDEE